MADHRERVMTGEDSESDEEDDALQFLTQGNVNDDDDIEDDENDGDDGEAEAEDGDGPGLYTK